MLSIATGHSTTYLTDQVGAGMESYYTGAVGAGEPPGKWWGKGAAALGLEGDVDADVMAGVYGSFLNPLDERFADPDTRDQSAVLGRRPKRFRTPEQVVEDRIREYTAEYASTPTPEQVQGWRIEAERDSQSAVHFYDMTFSPDKSVTVLHAAFVRAGVDARQAGDDAAAERWEWAAAEVEDAVMTASAVGLDYVERRAAYTRTGKHGRGGTGQWQDIHALTVARFFQHTSRDEDPQLHVHQAVFVKVQGKDGQWRALDGKPLHSARAAVAAVSERELEVELSRRLGVTWEMRDDGVGHRVAGVERDLEDLFSSRRRAITAEAEKRLEAFEEKYGRPATAAERAVIERRSAMATRRAKSHDRESVEEQNERWQAMASTAIAGGLAAVAETFAPVVEAAADGRLEELEAAGDGRFSAENVIVEALEACHGPDGKATFTRHDLIRQLHLALPAHLGPLEPGQAGALLEQLADRALEHEDVVQVAGREVGTVPASARLSDGTAATVNPAKVQYATRGHLAAEMAVLRSAGVRGRTSLPAAQVEAWLEEHPVGATLNPAQRAALVGLATSDAATAVLVGPAGTGKSYTAAAFDLAWRDLTAARDGAGERPGRAVGVAITQAAADVLADDGLADTANVAAFLSAQARLAGGSPMPQDERWRLSSSDVLLVDEASMADTRSLNRLQAAVDAAGARMVMMGDPHQLGPVGAGGMMRAAIDRDAETYSLSDVRRFTSEWERSASLRVRDGDPDAITEYDRRGRVRDGGREREAVAAIAQAAAADRLAGKDVVVVMATNEHAAQVSAQVRRVLADAGVVGEAAVVLERDGTGAGVGDLVQARRIDRELGLVNREVYRVEAVEEDGALRVTSTRTGAEHVMPQAYVAADVSLAYASTAHGAQGRTVDVGHVLLTPHLDRAGAYVGLTRGRESNTAWAVTDTGIPEVPATTGRAMLADALGVESARTPADAGAGDVAADAAAVDVEAADEAHRRHAGTLLGLIEDQTHLASRSRLDGMLDTLQVDGLLTEGQRARLGAEQGTEHLARLLRTHELAGRDPHEVLRDAVTAGSLDNALALSQVVAARIDKAWTRAATQDGTVTGAGLPEPVGHPLPAGTSDEAAGYLEELHQLLADRRRELGEQLAAAAEAGDELPLWVTATVGLPPAEADAVDAYASTDGGAAPSQDLSSTDDVQGTGAGRPATRQEWVDRAGTVAAHREATGWTHPEIALGRCPGSSSPEKRAAWHLAYTAAGMPEERRPEAEMTDGRLLVRARAAERAAAAAPPAVYEAQRERHRQAEDARRGAVLAHARGDLIEAARLEADADWHTTAAQHLDEIADARTHWLLASAETLNAGDAARDELARRGITPGLEPDRVTATEWLAAEAEARAADDAHRPITEHDLADQYDATAAVDTAAQMEVVDTTAADQSAVVASRAASLARVSGYTQAEVDLIHAAAEAKGLHVTIDAGIVPDGTFAPTPRGRHRPELARILRDLDRSEHRNVRDQAADLSSGDVTIRQDDGAGRVVSSLSAEATASEIAAASARARLTVDQLADHTSHDQTAKASADDAEWDYAQSKAASVDLELDVHDTTHDRDEAYLAAWNDRHDAASADDTAGTGA